MVASRTATYPKSSHRRLYDSAAGGFLERGRKDGWRRWVRVASFANIAQCIEGWHVVITILVEGLCHDVGSVGKPTHRSHPNQKLAGASLRLQQREWVRDSRQSRLRPTSQKLPIKKPQAGKRERVGWRGGLNITRPLRRTGLPIYARIPPFLLLFRRALLQPLFRLPGTARA
jgi:hypothetical protein